MEKVAIINSFLDYGSTGSITRQLYDYGLAQGYEPYVFYGRYSAGDNEHLFRIDSKYEVYAHKILALLTGYQGYFSNIATSRLINILKSNKIRKAILLNLHGYYLNERRLLEYLKDNSIQTVYITPDEYAGLGKCCYSGECIKYQTGCFDCPDIKGYPKSLFFDRSRAMFQMKKKAYDGFDKLTLLGPETNLVKFRTSALTKGMKMVRASWGIDLGLYQYEVDDSLFEKYKIPRDKVLILTVAKYSDPRKGVKDYFFEIAKRFQGSDYHFINVGYDGNLSSDEIPTNMTTIGYLNNQKELAHLYSMSDLYLLASTSDTMPLSCLISFGCETPVCCFYTSGLRFLAPESHPAVVYSKDISLDGLESIITKIDKKTIEIRNACRRLAEEEYSVTAFNRKVFEVFERNGENK